MVQIDESKIKAIGEVLKNKDRPLKERFRALFTLKNLGGPEAIRCISEVFSDDSVLLKHELAYCLGQMQDTAALPYLNAVLADKTQEPMVRHEAAEALGAIGDPNSVEILKQYIDDPIIEVRETCEIALGRLNWLKQKEKKDPIDENPYASVDPSPPANCNNLTELKDILLSENESLFDRYRAMFSLRNLRTNDSALALGDGLKCGSALFRHEIAFVLGQLQEPCTVPCLAECLRNQNENEMVRHECAEALGAIATDECVELLKEYLNDEKRVVKESCIVALDMCEYENSPEFQYANVLQKVEQ